MAQMAKLFEGKMWINLDKVRSVHALPPAAHGKEPVLLIRFDRESESSVENMEIPDNFDHRDALGLHNFRELSPK